MRVIFARLGRRPLTFLRLNPDRSGGSTPLKQRVAAPDDIDKAVRLGLGYPKGPLAMGDGVGAKRILAVLDGMYSVYRDPRYRPSPWLRRRAMLGVSLLTPEG